MVAKVAMAGETAAEYDGRQALLFIDDPLPLCLPLYLPFVLVLQNSLPSQGRCEFFVTEVFAVLWTAL